LKMKIIVYVKDEGSNLITMIVALKVVVSCANLSLEESYQGTLVENGHFATGPYD